ncbi:MAG: O-Antigen ligase [Verrucomicrobiales bacterium]|nr:O-Antigen ligase [Verrucomicrobiales bacterium]
MMRFIEGVWLFIFLAGLLVVGVFGTWSETAPFWYGAGLICVAGAGSLISRPSHADQRIAWRWILVMGVFLAYIFWRGLTSEVKWLARQDLVFAAAALVTYGLTAVVFTGNKSRLAILGILFLLIAGNTGLGLYQYFENPRMSIFHFFGLRRAAEVTAGGFYESANHMAGFMTLAGLPLLGVAVLGRGLPMGVRITSILGFLLAGVGVAFSTSRGGALSFFGGMGILILFAFVLWMKERKSRSGRGNTAAGKWLVGLAFLFVGLLGAAAVVLRKVFATGQDLKSLNGRGPLWDAAMEQWQTSPIIGTGARSYEYMERGFRTLETKWMTWAGQVDAQFAHNDYLQCLGEYGLVGLILALLVAGVHFWNALSSALTTDREAPASATGLATGLAMGSSAAIAGLMLQSLADFNLHIGTNVVATALLLGFMATPGFLKPKPKAEPRNPNPAPRPKAGAGVSGRRLATCGVLAAVSVILIHSALKFAPADLAYRQGLKQIAFASTLPEFIKTSGTFQQATALDPDNCMAWSWRGQVTVQIASLTSEKYARPFYDAALAHLDRCLALYPQNPYAAAQAGNVAGYLGQMPAAENYFRSALRWGLNIQSVNELYGDFLIRKKDYYGAVPYLTLGLHLSGDQVTRANLQRKIDLCLKALQKHGLKPPPSPLTPP